MDTAKHIEYYNLTDYKENYDFRLKKFCDNFIDTDELDFLTNDLFQFKSYLEFSEENENLIWSKLNPNNIEELIVIRKDILDSIRSYKKIIELIEKRIKEVEILKNNSISEINTKAPILTLKWSGSELEFTELIKSLIELKMIGTELNQNEVFKRLKLFFELNEFNENDKIREITNRTNTPTPFINKLETALNNYRNKKLEKRKN